MLLDTSALLAVLFAEPEATAMVRAVSMDPVRLVGAPCLSYGMAMGEREPLLFKGDDFARTDVPAVAY